MAARGRLSQKKEEKAMMRMLPLTTLVAAAALCGATFAITSATAQTQTPACGPEVYSQAEQKYVGMPCTAATPKADAGKAAPCGPEVYSQAEQKYVGMPCTAETPKAEAGKEAPCGPEVYSQAEQRYVGVPCAHR
jgi:hypothetical protein